MKYRHAAFAGVALGAALALASPAPAAITVTDDPILYWNDRALALFPGGPHLQTRAYAMMNIAMHDAVNATLGGPNNGYLSGVSAPGGNSRAAASQAARDVLVALNPGNAAHYDMALAQSLATITDGADKAAGVATGAAYASAILGFRSADGSAATGSYATTGLPGDWRPTSAGSAAAPHWGAVDPFIMATGDQFRPGPPPALGSADYAAAYNEVKAIGSATSATRTADQTASALFWDAANGAPWLRIGVTIAEDEGLSTIDNARAFALLTTSMADGIIAGFDAKYHHRLWRPITAIHGGEFDGNAATAGDPQWASLFAAPLHPSYISTHSTLSGVGLSVLSSIFGDDEAFALTIAGDTRHFAGLSDAALDGSNSRLWGGIHFRFDNEAGLALGQRIGGHALAGRAFNAVPEPATWAMMIGGFGLVGGAMRRRAGRIACASA